VRVKAQMVVFSLLVKFAVGENMAQKPLTALQALSAVNSDIQAAFGKYLVRIKAQMVVFSLRVKICRRRKHGAKTADSAPSAVSGKSRIFRPPPANISFESKHKWLFLA
jgi:hypothetical protein